MAASKKRKTSRAEWLARKRREDEDARRPVLRKEPRLQEVEIEPSATTDDPIVDIDPALEWMPANAIAKLPARHDWRFPSEPEIVSRYGHDGLFRGQCEGCGATALFSEAAVRLTRAVGPGPCIPHPAEDR